MGNPRGGRANEKTYAGNERREGGGIGERRRGEEARMPGKERKVAEFGYGISWGDWLDV